jgi:hypothetical protein
MHGGDMGLTKSEAPSPESKVFLVPNLGLRTLVLGLILSASSEAQTPRSQLASVTQSLAGTQIDLVYRRPSARGRELFGSLVPWDRVWSPSADSAVQFTTSQPIEVNGSALAAGEYALWAIPGQKEWTFIFNSQAHVFHLRHSEATDVLRVKAVPESADPPTETLTFFFAAADADSATLRMQWGKTSIPLKVRAKKP